MKSLAKISLVLLALLLSLFLLERAIGTGLRHNLNLKMIDVAANPKNVPLLVHGPCEPLWMVSPALLDPLTGIRSYNLSLSHSDFADNYLHLYWYLLHNKAPEFLWFYVTPESFDLRFNTFNAYRFSAWLGDSVIRSVVRDCDPSYESMINIPLMRYSYYGNKTLFDALQGYYHWVRHRGSAYYPDGFEPPARRVWGNHNGEFVELYDQYIHFEWDQRRERYFRKILDLAWAAGIKVFLYESPVLAEALPFQPNRGEIIRRIRSIANEYRLPFIQFENTEMARHRSNFVSTLNFNMQGVQLFNDTFAKVIRQYCIGAR